MNTPPRFLCDGMLGGLCRYLRAAGYDTLLANDGEADRDLLRLCHDQGRHFLTHDRLIREVVRMLAAGVRAISALLACRLNWMNAITAVLFVMPFFYLLRRYWGASVALAANVMLMFIPVWWNTSLYGHPVMQAMLFTVVGLLALAQASSERHGAGVRGATLQVVAITMLAIALTFRLDVVLMFPLLAAVLWMEGHSFKDSIGRSLAYGALAILLAVILKWGVHGLGLEGGTGVSRITERLGYWHNLNRLTSNFQRGTLLLFSHYIRCVDAVTNRAVGFSTGSPFPTPMVMELVATTPVRLLEIGEAEYKKLSEVDPTYSPTIIPADTYKGVSADIKTVASPVIMYTTEDMPDELAYTLTKAFWENRKLIADAHATGKGLDITGVRYGVAKVHPGAQRYYKEKNVELPASMR